MSRLRSNGRGVHPKVRSSSFRFWPLDGTATDVARELITGDGARDFITFGVSDNGEMIASPIGSGGRRFIAADNTMMISADASGDSPTMQGEWTAHTWLKPRANGVGVKDAIWSLAGDNDLNVLAHNTQASLAITTAGEWCLFWEDGAGVDHSNTFTAFIARLNKWQCVTLRCRDAGGGLRDVDLFVNGELMETLAGITAPDGGTDPRVRWTLGGSAQSIETPVDEVTADVSSLQVYSAVLTADEIREDFRRGMLQPFFTTIDLKVEVGDANGNSRDLTDLDSVDFVDSVSVTLADDNASNTANVTLIREVENLSVAHLKTDTKLNLTDVDDVTSYDPMLEVVRDVEILAARTPLGIRASGLDWQSVLKGNVDLVDWGSDDRVTLNCRDESGRQVDTYVEEEVLNNTIIVGAPIEKQPSYGLLVGEPVEDVIQKILDDNDNDAGNNSVGGLVPRLGSYAPVTLDVPVSPLWDLLPYRQRREPVMAAIRTLAGQVGWECKRRFKEGDFPEDDAWVMQLYPPERDRLDNDVHLEPSDILGIGRASLDVKDIRNVVRILYPSSETVSPDPPPALPAGFSQSVGWAGVNGEGNRVPAFIEVRDDASILRFGRRFMEISEAQSSQIDTVAEAQAMAFGCLRDLSSPDFEKTIEVPCLFELEPGDMMRFTSNDQLYTGIQKLAVRSVTHTFAGQATSSFQLRGKPSVGSKRWLSIESRPGQARPGIADPNLALTDSESGPLLRVVRQLLDSTSLLTGGKFLSIRNPEFSDFTAGTENTPDGWQIVGGGGWDGTQAIVNAYLSADSQSGKHSIGMDLGNGVLTSDFIAVQPTAFQPYAVELLWKTLTDANTYPVVTFRWFDEDKNPIEPYGANHSNRSLHPADRDPSATAVRNARRVGVVNQPPTAGIGDAQLQPGVAEVDQFLVGDVIDYVASALLSPAWEFTARRGLVVAIDNVSAVGVPRYNIDYVTEPVPATAGNHIDEGAMAYRPFEFRVPLAAAVNEWEESRQTGIEPPSVDARFVRIEIEIDREGLGPTADVLIDSINIYKVGRELRMTTPVPTNQAFTDDQWSHCRHQSPHPGPTPANATGPLFRAGYDFGDNFDDDGFAAATNNTGPHFVARANGYVEVKGLFAVRQVGDLTRARLRIVKDGLYNDGVGVGAFASTAGTPCCYGPWSDNAQDVGLPQTDMVVVSISDRIQVQVGDRLNLEAYIEVDGATSAALVQDPELNFSYFKMIPNY